MGEVEIQIGRDGKVVVRTNGIKGPRCLEYTKFIQELIGREESRVITREFHEPDGQVRTFTENQQRR